MAIYNKKIISLESILILVTMTISISCTGLKPASPKEILNAYSTAFAGSDYESKLNSSQIWDSIPWGNSISVRTFRTFDVEWEHREISQLFGAALAGEIWKNLLFKEVLIISSNETPSTDLVIEGEIIYAGGVEGIYEFDISGRLIDLRKDKALLTFQLARFRSRGLLKAFDEKLTIRTCMKMVAEDIVTILRNIKKKGNSH